MRELKFKAWDKTNNEWYMNGDTFDLNFSGEYGDFFFDNDNPRNMRSVKLIWVQYTGLHDKNGKMIYDGDRIQVSISDGCGGFFRETEDCYVSYNNEGARFVLSSATDDVKESIEFMNLNIYEVIGSRYENLGMSGE